MNFAKPALLSKVMFVYSIFLSLVLFPFAKQHDAWVVYAWIVSLAFILSFGMFLLSRKRKKEV